MTPATRMSAIGAMLFSLGLVGLGGIGLAFADVPVQWRPIASLAPLRAPVGIATALLLLFAGIGLQFHKTRRAAGCLGAVAFLCWALLLHAPRLPGAWHAVAECGALAIGALALVDDVTRQRYDLAVRYPLGICFIAFGAAHFVYAQFTISFMPIAIPPGRAFWVYATGVGLIAAGVSLLVNIASRLAATLVGVMFSSFVLFVHVPRLWATPNSRLEWTVVCVALALTGTAWNVAGSLAESSDAEARDAAYGATCTRPLARTKSAILRR